MRGLQLRRWFPGRVPWMWREVMGFLRNRSRIGGGAQKTRVVSSPEAEGGSVVPLVVGRDRAETSAAHIQMDVGGVVARQPAEVLSSRILYIARALRRPGV